MAVRPKVSGVAAEHPLVEKIVGDPTSLDDFTVVSGYVGRSNRDGYLRIYTSLNFNRFVEVQEQAVVHREDSPAAVLAGRSLLWIKSDAVLAPGSRVAGGAGQGAKFLAGDIAARNLRAQATSRRGPFARVNSVDICLSDLNCPTDSPRRCPTIACPGFTAQCHTEVCETAVNCVTQVACVTQLCGPGSTLINCETVDPNCLPF